MNLSGWVAVRRGILEHMLTGKLSMSETLVLTVLILLADSSTGRGYINGPSLRAWIPELEYDSAKQILQSLEEKRFIWRQIKHGSKAAYPYWVDKYEPSKGRHKGLLTNLSKVFDSNDAKDVEYVKVSPEEQPAIPPERPPHLPLHPPLNNNKNKNTDKNKNTTSSVNDASAAMLQTVQQRSANTAPGAVTALRQHRDSTATAQRHQGVGIQWNEDGSFVDIPTGRQISIPTASWRANAIGLDYRNGDFVDDNGLVVPKEIARELLSGTERNAA
jgi:hypothetical protein